MIRKHENNKMYLRIQLKGYTELWILLICIVSIFGERDFYLKWTSEIKVIQYCILPVVFKNMALANTKI